MPQRRDLSRVLDDADPLDHFAGALQHDAAVFCEERPRQPVMSRVRTDAPLRTPPRSRRSREGIRPALRRNCPAPVHVRSRGLAAADSCSASHRFLVTEVDQQVRIGSGQHQHARRPDVIAEKPDVGRFDHDDGSRFSSSSVSRTRVWRRSSVAVSGSDIGGVYSAIDSCGRVDIVARCARSARTASSQPSSSCIRGVASEAEGSGRQTDVAIPPGPASRRCDRGLRQRQLRVRLAPRRAGPAPGGHDRGSRGPTGYGRVSHEPGRGRRESRRPAGPLAGTLRRVVRRR